MNCAESSPPIDLALADQLFPLLESAAKNLEHLSKLYEELDDFFWRNFLELFSDPDDPCPPGKAWQTLLQLRSTAELSVLTEPLIHLAQNNNRAGMAVEILKSLLKR